MGHSTVQKELPTLMICTWVKVHYYQLGTWASDYLHAVFTFSIHDHVWSVRISHTCLGCGMAPRVRHGSDSSASACCMAGSGSNLDSAPHRRPSTERKKRGDQEWHSTSIMYKILYVCSFNVKINKKEWQHATKPLTFKCFEKAILS
jgi:hypothetical protein